MKDIIYRDEAVEICERWRQRAKEHNDQDGWYMADTLSRFMKEMSSADRPQGEWICIEWNENIEGYIVPMRTYKCSICGEREAASTRFCPNCGCRMKGADDE